MPRSRAKVEEEEIEDEIASDELDDEDPSSEDESESDDERPRKKTKPFVAPPPRELPQRTTRGQRLGTVAAIEDEGADEEFWNQEFFAEEQEDEQYETESEPEDEFDRDFNESEDDDADEDLDSEAEADAREPKRKTIRPPGYKAKPPPRPKSQPKTKTTDSEAAADEDEKPAEKPAPKRRRPSDEVVVPAERTMGVRLSTRQKVQDAEEMRTIQEALKPRRVYKQATHRQLTQAELLAEAAKTEIENTKSLQYLVWVEEETKKKAQVKKGKYVGPMVRYRSHAVNNEEQSTLEVRNMQTPEEYLPCTAPPLPQPALCVVTGKPARFKDPATGAPYADIEAFQELKRRREAALVLEQQQAAQQLQWQQQQLLQQQQHQRQYAF